MGDSLSLGDILPTLTLRVQRGRTLHRSWIFLPHATYLGHRPPTDRLDRLFSFPRVPELLDFLVHDAKPSLLLHELFWSPIITLGTTMLSNLQPLTDGCKASWAGLVSTVGVDFSKVHPTLPTNPFCQREKLSFFSIKTVFTEHPARQPFDIEVFGKDGLRSRAKFMRRFQMKVKATISNPMLHSARLRFAPSPCF